MTTAAPHAGAGVVVWLTGLPSSGKSTLARALHAALGAMRRPACVLDGDDVRRALVPAHGHDTQGRAQFYATLGRLAALLAEQGLVVLVAATAHQRAFRAAARAASPRFVEVHLAAPLALCRARDSKGLYARALHGELADLPGAGADYEPPLHAEVVVEAAEQESMALARIIAAIDAASAP